MRRTAFFLLLLAGIGALIAAFLIKPGVGHPVTPLMAEAAAGASGKRIPLPPGASGRRPAVVIFIVPGCPCSEAYEPYTHELFAAYGDRADFIGVVAGEAKDAEEWRREHRTPYRVVADPKHASARDYGAERSAYTALVLDGGTLQHLWPGYSGEMLHDLGGRLAAATRTEAAALTLAKAPKPLTSGCRID